MRDRLPGSLYALHPSYRMEEAGRRNLAERTGKTLEEWVEFLRENGPGEVAAAAAWLKSAHGLTTNYAAWVAERAAGRGAPEQYDPENLVEAMFAGQRAGLKPLYDRLLDLCLSFAEDVSASPCETIVPIFRNHVIAQIKPSARARIDFGLALRDTHAEPPLVDTGGFAKKDRITHRIPISEARDIGVSLRDWFRRAYEMDA